MTPVALIVPVPLTVSEAPLPTTIAALVFVPLVMAEKAALAQSALVTFRLPLASVSMQRLAVVAPVQVAN